MRKTILLTATILCSLPAMAQPWLEKFEGQRVKLEDVVEGYRKKNPVQDNTNTDHAIEFEGKGYHFHRWLNFWEGRTDENGYLVSTRKHWEEMKKLRAQHASNKSAAKNTSSDVNWTFHGPTNPLGGNFGVGRINVIEFHPTDTNTYMIGTPGGGIWKTTTDGSTWTALDDFLPILGVSDIDYNPQNPNTIYICTGDRDASDTYSMGVFKSTDGGTTWDTTGFQYAFSDLKKTNGLLINPQDTNSLTLATSDGIYKSADAGATWVLQFGGNFQQILAHPTDTAIMFASGSASGGRSLFRSADGGATWQNIISPSGIIRIEIAVTAANPAIVKFIAANTQYGLEGIYNSTDTGKTFTRIFDGGGSNCNTNILASTPDGDACGGQGWYDLTIQISPLNANDVIVGGVNTWFSRNGGTSWTVANQWRNTVTGVTIVHADKHFHKFHPLKPTVLYECNDGGLHRTGAPMSSDAIWTDISEGLGITQFYRNAVGNNTSYVLGGTQDNGSKMLVGGTSKQMTGADGMECQIDPVDSNILYTSQQYGELRRSTNGGQNFTDIQNNIPGRPDGAWITPLIIHPAGRNILLTGYNYVYLSLDYGDTWAAISPNFFTNISRLATTPIDQDYIYMAIVTQSTSTLRYTTDLGTNWKGITALNQNTVSDIMADPRDKDRMWVTYRSYNGDKVAVVDLKSNTWTKYNTNLPEVPVNCIAFDHMNQTFYIGTDLGVYYREYNDPNWKYFNNNTLPNVEIFDLGINNTSNTIWAATYGRGMWSSPLHKSTTSVSNTIPLATDVITIAPNPNYGAFVINTRNSVLQGKTTIVRIVNMLGATVWSNEVTINNSGNANVKAELPRGTYMVEIIYDNTVFAKSKMVVY